MRFVSLFAGIGGFDLAFERVGMTCVGQVEYDEHATAVLEHHWPDVPRISDVRDFQGHEFGEVDLLCGGFPCQPHSLAGKRKGSEDERDMWPEFARLIRTIKPRWVVAENVPGLLSSDGGLYIEKVLDDLEEAGYIVDMDIKDARDFGVAQRRRRLFLVCQQVDDLLKMRTTLSALTIAQCLIEILPSVLEEVGSLSSIEYAISDLPKTFSVDGRRRKMKLFGLADRSRWALLLENLDAERARFPQEHELLDWIPGASGAGTQRTVSETSLLDMSSETAVQFASTNTVPSWSDILGVICDLPRLSTTSTSTTETIESRIFICARAALSIGTFIILSNPSHPSYWSAISSVLIVLKEFTSYARQAGSSLFTPTKWVQPWRDFVAQSERACEVIRGLGNGRAAEVLFEPEGGTGLTRQSRKTRPELARDVAASLRGSGGQHRGWSADAESSLAVVPNAETFRMRGFGDYDDDGTASALKQRDYKDATDLVVPLSFEPRYYTRDNKTGGAPGDTVDITNAHKGGDSAPHVLAFQQNQRDELRLMDGDGQIAGSLAAQPGMKNQNFILASPIANALKSAAGGADVNDAQGGRLVAYNLQTNDGGGHKRKDRPNGGMYVSETETSLTVGSTDQTLVAAFSAGQGAKAGGIGYEEEMAPTLRSADSGTNQVPTIAITERTRADGRTFESQEELAYALTNPGSGGRTHSRQIAGGFGVRRLTPAECERLQGFPTGWTLIPADRISKRDDHDVAYIRHHVRLAYGLEISEEMARRFVADTHRYRQLGNAVCVNVLEWIGRRIMEVEYR